MESVALNLLSINKVLERTETAFESGEAFSLVRLGDGESIILGYPDFVHQNRYMKWMGDFFGSHAKSADTFSELADSIREAIRTADVVGGYREALRDPEAGRQACLGIGKSTNLSEDQKNEISYLEWRLLWEHINGLISDGSLYTSTGIHMKLEESGLLRRIISSSNEISLITGNDLRNRFAAGFPGKKIWHHMVPTEYKWAEDKSGWEHSKAHFPQVYGELIARIRRGELGRVVLIGAGPCGKVYASEVKRIGGFAIDVGSVMDVWANRKTRSYMGTFNTITFPE